MMGAGFPFKGNTHRPQSSSFLGLPYRIQKRGTQKGTTLGPMGSWILPRLSNSIKQYTSSRVLQGL